MGGSDTVHWDGTAWQRVTAHIEGRMSSVVALSPNDAWAVGDARKRRGEPNRFIMHWNGKKWTQVDGPRVGH